MELNEGTWLEGHATARSVNPFDTDNGIDEYAQPDAKQVASAREVMREAFAQWAGKTVRYLASVIDPIGIRILVRSDRARLFGTRELGKTIGEATDEAVGARFAIDVDQPIAGVAAAGGHKTSILRDILRRRPMKVNALVGSVRDPVCPTGVPTIRIDSAPALSRVCGDAAGCDQRGVGSWGPLDVISIRYAFPSCRRRARTVNSRRPAGVIQVQSCLARKDTCPSHGRPSGSFLISMQECATSCSVRRVVGPNSRFKPPRRYDHV